MTSFNIRKWPVPVELIPYKKAYIINGQEKIDTTIDPITDGCKLEAMHH